jgi:branched-chain amino acid transport system substrate-binding protein
MIKWGLACGAPLILCGVLVVTACGVRPAVSRDAFQQTVDIALVGTFSGGGSLAGDNLKHSLQVEADAINNSGGLLGKRVEVIAADDEGNPDKARLLAHQLATDPDVKLVVGPGSNAMFQATKAELARIPMPNCVSTQISDDAFQGASASFRTQPSIAATVQVLLQNLRQRHPDVRKVGLISSDGPDGHAYDARLSAEAKRAGLDYAGAELAADPAADQQPLVQDLLGKGAQAIMLSGDPAFAGRTAQAVGLVAQAAKPQLMGPPALAGSQFADTGGQAAIGTVFASTIQAYQTDMPSAQWPGLYRSFVNAITSQYGYVAGGTEMQGSAPAADCVVGWAAAARAAGGFDGQQVIKAWEALDLPASATVLGTRERFSAGDHDAVAADSLFVYQWQASGTQRRLKQLAGP